MASFPQYKRSTTPPETHSVTAHIKIPTPKSRSKSPTRGASRPIITPRPPSKLSVGETSGSGPTRPGLALGRPKTAPVTSGVGPTLPGAVKPITGVGRGGPMSVGVNGGHIEEKKVNLKLENVDKWNALATQKPAISTVTDDKSNSVEASAASKRSDAAWEEFKRQRREEHDRAKLLAAQVDERKRQAEMEERKKKQEEEEQKKKKEIEERAKKDEVKARIERMREEERKAREERYQKDTVDLFAQSIIMAKFEKEMYQSQDFVRRQKDELRRQERMIKTFAGKNQKPLTVLGQLSDVARAALLGRSNGGAAGRDVKEGSENGATPRAVSEDAKTPMDMEVVDTEDMAYEPTSM